MNEENANSRAPFPTTHWSLMFSLRASRHEAMRQRAFEQICETYWFPLYAFARHRGYAKHDAEDAVQSFFCMVGSEEYFQQADQELGKLRTFLLTGFTRYLKDLNERKNALKRGGGQIVLSLDVNQAEEWVNGEPIADEAEQVLSFERDWAFTIIRKAMATLEQEASSSEKNLERFHALKCFLSPQDAVAASRDEIARSLGMTTDACDKAIQRMRNSFRMAVKEIIIGTLKEPNEETIREEMVQLQRALLRG